MCDAAVRYSKTLGCEFISMYRSKPSLNEK